MPRKNLSRAIQISMCAVLLGSCGTDFEINRGGELYGINPNFFSYRYVVVPEDASYGYEVKRALMRRGYSVLVGEPSEIADRYLLRPEQTAEIRCGGFEEQQFDQGNRSVIIHCELLDLANGERIYRGWGEYKGPPGELDYISAAFTALWDLPRASMSGGEVTELPFNERPARDRDSVVAGHSPSRPDEPSTTPDSTFTSSGTAFFVSLQGHLLTNQHVIDGCRRARIFHQNAYHAVTVQSEDADLDLAVLKWNGIATNAVEFRTGRFIRAGESVIAVGYPLRGLLADEATVTTGIVNTMAGIGNDRRFIQISAQVQPGNSGGPLLDGSGRLVGVVVSKLDAATVFAVTGDIPQNVNFAINGQLATDFLNARGVPYAFSFVDSEIGTANVADAAKRYTVPVECSPAG